MKSKMKWMVIVAAIFAAFIGSASAQTNTLNITGTNSIVGGLSQPVQIVANYLAANTNAPAASNWTVAPYFSKADNGKYGGGIAAVYYVNPYVGTQIRMQYLDIGNGAEVWLPNGTITLQSAYQPLGVTIPLTIRPMVEAGAAVNLKGELMAIAGAGGEIDLYHNSDPTSVFQRLSIFGGIEKWQGQNTSLNVEQFGFAVNLNLESLIKKLTGN